MESPDEIAMRLSDEDITFEEEAQELRKVLRSLRRRRWLPWVHEPPAVDEPIRSEFGGAILTLQHCWQVQDANLYLTADSGVLYRDANGDLVSTLNIRAHGPIVQLTNAMREMRESLTGKRG